LAQARTRRTPAADGLRPLTAHVGRGLREAVFLVSLAVAGYFLVSLVTFNPADPGWSHAGSVDRIANAGGVVGAWFADLLLYLFGFLAFMLPVMIAYSGWLVLKRTGGPEEAPRYDILTVRWAGFLLVMVSGCALASLHFQAQPGTVPVDAGGVLGQLAGMGLAGVMGILGSTLLHLALFLAGITLFTGVSWLSVMDFVGKYTLAGVLHLRQGLTWIATYLEGRRRRHQREAQVKVEREKKQRRKPVKIEPVVSRVEESARAQKERQIPLFETPKGRGRVPPLSLLDGAPAKVGGYSAESLEAMSRQLELKLQDFGVHVEVEAVHPGPVITRFELQPAAGVKVSQISNLAKDLARALSVISVRVVEVIPGKSVIGLEVPNEKRELVVLSEILKSSAYDQSGSPLTLALGKDIGGSPVVADLARMPHLLVAGTTGSGKSVAVNAMLLSLLYKASPEQVRLILIDPKMLELNVYEGIAHLLAPVVTDMKDAANALRWCVGEMERRYKLMASQGVRNISGYNRRVKDAMEAGEPIPDPLYDPNLSLDPEAEPPTLQPLPYIVVVVDEFADMMMVVGKKVEELIARLAQKARASGIHLILATQRPSVDVITGLIKANIPSRIAFQVSAKVDSRTILDQMGAEQLLGHGDMLFLPPGTALPRRVHGAFVSDQEVHRVVERLKSQGEPEYLDAVLNEDQEAVLPGEQRSADGGGEADPLYDEAVAVVTESRKASISYVQRRLKIGYNRAARMIEEMELAGVVSPVQANGTREVLAPASPPG
jgi:S-DNA-T family DNA segregation ATPase FtsK/SpoIIIE